MPQLTLNVSFEILELKAAIQAAVGVRRYEGAKREAEAAVAEAATDAIIGYTNSSTAVLHDGHRTVIQVRKGRLVETSVQDFVRSSERVTVSYNDNKTVRLAWAKIWAEDDRRNNCERRVFWPPPLTAGEAEAVASGSVFNEYTGPGISREEAEAADLNAPALLWWKAYVRRHWCEDKDEIYTWFVTTLAGWVQKPRLHSLTSIFARGKEGAFKTALFTILGKIIGQQYTDQIASPEMLMGQRLGWLERSLLVILDEVRFPRPEDFAACWKRLTGADRVKGARLYHEAETFQLQMKLVVISNEAKVAQVSGACRRSGIFCVDHVATAEDQAMIARLDEDPRPLARYLYSLHVPEGFERQRPPKTKEKIRQVGLSLDRFAAWWAGCLQRGSIALGYEFAQDAPIAVPKNRIHEAYLADTQHRADARNSGELFARLAKISGYEDAGRPRIDGVQVAVARFPSFPQLLEIFRRETGLEDFELLPGEEPAQGPAQEPDAAAADRAEEEDAIAMLEAILAGGGDQDLAGLA